jgi:hypothetical protein
MFGYGSSGIEVLALVGLAAFFFFRQKGNSSIPNLVLRRFYVGQAQNGYYVDIAGRPPGLIAWILMKLGLEAETVMRVSADSLTYKSSSLFGQAYSVVPLNAISSTHSGYLKNFVVLLLGTGALLFGLSSLFSRNGALGVAMIVVGAFLLFRYWISKNVTIYVQTTGGATLGLSFSRSIIEGVALDAKQALNAIMVINRLIQHARGLSSEYHDDMSDFEAKPKRPPVRVSVERD